MPQFIKIQNTIINPSLIAFIDIAEGHDEDHKHIYYIVVTYMIERDSSRFDFSTSKERDNEYDKIIKLLTPNND